MLVFFPFRFRFPGDVSPVVPPKAAEASLDSSATSLPPLIPTFLLLHKGLIFVFSPPSDVADRLANCFFFTSLGPRWEYFFGSAAQGRVFDDPLFVGFVAIPPGCFDFFPPDPPFSISFPRRHQNRQSNALTPPRASVGSSGPPCVTRCPPGSGVTSTSKTCRGFIGARGFAPIRNHFERTLLSRPLSLSTPPATGAASGFPMFFSF